MQMLYDEHTIIVNAIDTAKQLKSLIGKDDSHYEQTVRDLIRFFRNYADKFHHYKEEQILFPEMIKKNYLLDEGVVKEMFENHGDFRDMVKKTEQYLDAKDYHAAQKQLEKYGEALLDHIAVENDEVFQIAETLFNADELETIYFRFQDVDREIGKDLKEELAELSENLRKEVHFSS